MAALAGNQTFQADWEPLVSLLPGDWQDLAVETGALKGLCMDKSAAHLLRTLPLHFGHGHSLLGTTWRIRHAELADLSAVERLKKSKDCLQVGHRTREHGALRFRTAAGAAVEWLAKYARRRTGQTNLWEVRMVDPEGRSGRLQTWDFAKYVFVFTTFPAADFPTARRLSVIVQRSAYQGDIGPCREQRLNQVGAGQSPEPRSRGHLLQYQRDTGDHGTHPVGGSMFQARAARHQPCGPPRIPARGRQSLAGRFKSCRSLLFSWIRISPGSCNCISGPLETRNSIRHGNGL